MNQTTEAAPKVCIASHLFYPTYGGSQNRYLGYLPGLRERGLDVRVFAGTATPEDVTPDDVWARWNNYSWGTMLPVEVVNGTPLHRVRLPSHKNAIRRWMFNRGIYRYCRDPKLRPDVLQLVGTLRVGSVPWIRRLRGMGIATLYSVTIASKVKRDEKGLNLRLLKFRLLYDSMDCIVTNNSPLSDSLRAMGVKSRVEVIPNGVDLTRFQPASDAKAVSDLRRDLGIGERDLMILAVGAVIPRKGCDLLVEAWSRLNRAHGHIHLVFLGPRYEKGESHHDAFQSRMDTLVSQSGAPERVHFVGVSDRVPSYLQAADIFVLSSRREGMPNSVLEAMACRKPVVMTPFEGLSDDLGHADRDYLLAQHDPDSLAEALAKLVNDPGLREKLAERGWKWIRENMSLERSLDLYAELYKELADQARSRKPSAPAP